LHEECSYGTIGETMAGYTPSQRGIRALRSASSIAALVAVVTLPLTAAADIYQYVDAEGVVHFTSVKPAAPNAKLYMKSDPKPSAGGGARPGVLPYAPQDRNIDRFTRYDEHIRQAAALYQIPEALIRAVIKVESDYDPRAVSYAGARGLMQLMPETAELLGVRDIHDPRENIFGGVRYLRVLANMFNGDLDFTIAAYNAGQNAVIQHRGIPPYAQTRDYVVKVNKFYRRYRTIPDPVEASLAPPEPMLAAPRPQPAQAQPIIVNAP
jgi:soluble lytic murein transglycosylase-like protein